MYSVYNCVYYIYLHIKRNSVAGDRGGREKGRGRGSEKIAGDRGRRKQREREGGRKKGRGRERKGEGEGEG